MKVEVKRGRTEVVSAIINGRRVTVQQRRKNFAPSMSVDLVHPAVEKTVLVLEGIGDGKVRVKRLLGNRGNQETTLRLLSLHRLCR